MTETTDTHDEAAEDVVEEAAEDNAAEEAETEEDNSTEESDAEEDGAAEEEDTEEAADEEPPTRKPRTNADWVALRRKQKLEKQNASKEEQGEAEDDESDEDDDVNDEDAKLIDQRIEKALTPLKEKEYENEVKGEIDEFVAKNPDFKKYTAKALKWAKHPSWRDVPTKQLMHAVAGEDLLKIGANRAKQVADKTKKTKTGAGNAGGSGGTKPVAEMSDEEFEQEIQRVKTQPRG